MLSVCPEADLAVGVLGDERRRHNAVTARARESWLAHLPFARTHHRWYLPLYPAAFSTIDTSGYDLVVSSSSAFAKTVHTDADTPHLCYCHTPPRYLWDLQRDYRRDTSLAGAALAIASPWLRRVDKASARRVDRFVANSHYVADRIRRYYGRDASVVYPPVAPKPATPTGRLRTDALLSFGRLVPYKRVDIAVQAATMLGEKLIVAGDGPERARLQRMAGPTVTFLGEVSEERAGELMESCRAMLFCAEEDFGIAPVEANAHGLPVVAYGRGAARESMLEGTTAEFFDEPTPDALAAAIARADARAWSDAAIRANAARFSTARFREGFTQQVLEVL
jgi:glycosyltransferase involved in cell wall biosynthesis